MKRGNILAVVAALMMLAACAKKQSGHHDQPEVIGDAEGTDPSVTDGTAKTCRLTLDCKAPLPDLGAVRSFKSTYSSLLSASGSPLHRGRDIFVKEGEKAWVLAKFTYGILDADLKGEDVDVYLSRDCQKPWEKLGTAVTSTDGQNPAVDAIVDSGGRVYYEIPEVLKVGRYRILLVVAGDHSTTELFIDVLPKDSKIVVTDVDGTLTSSELAAVSSVVGLPDPEAHPGAADMMRAFYQRGYFIYYLTARPEWLMQISREWLNSRGFPPGIINTTQSKTGASGAEATTFKSDELKLLKEKTAIVPSFAFGNKGSDAVAFGSAGIDAKHSYYYMATEDVGLGIVHSSYQDLVKTALEAPLACP